MLFSSSPFLSFISLSCVVLSFSTRKGFSGRLFYFFGKVDGWGEKESRRGSVVSRIVVVHGRYENNAQLIS